MSFKFVVTSLSVNVGLLLCFQVIKHSDFFLIVLCISSLYQSRNYTDANCFNNAISRGIDF